MRARVLTALTLTTVLLPATAATAATPTPPQAPAKPPISTDVTSVEKSAWVRWLPNALPAAGYITLKNSSDHPLDVTKIISPDYQRISIYQAVVDAESSKMVKVDKFTIPAHGEFAIVPGRYHLMLEKPTHLITPGDNARFIFFLSDGKVVKVKIPVRTSPELY